MLEIKNLHASATGVFKDLSEVLFTSQDGDIIVSLGATNKFNAKSNKFSVTKNANTTKEFEIKIPVDNFKMLPASEYTVAVKYNSSKKSYTLLNFLYPGYLFRHLIVISLINFF